jgi:hypothetical protein
MNVNQLGENYTRFYSKTELSKVYPNNIYVKEFSRVLNKGGELILSIPMLSSFVFKGAEKIKKGYFLIEKDPYEIRNGHVFRGFETKKEIIEVFEKLFCNFRYASLRDDCFGQKNHWHIIVCDKK